jgi:hypothetical protein
MKLGFYVQVSNRQILSYEVTKKLLYFKWIFLNHVFFRECSPSLKFFSQS